MVLIDAAHNINVYNYEGRHVSNPKYQGLRVEFLNKSSISVSSDVIGIIDTTNPKMIRIFDVNTGQPTNINIVNSNDIVAMQLNQTEMKNERKLCFIDSNRDMFLTMVNKPEIIKISSMVDSFSWNDNNDMLCCLSDNKLNTWFYPNAIYVDKDLMDQSKSSQEASNIGKFANINQFTGSMVSIIKLDGANATISVPPFAKILYEHIDKSDFEKAIRICRFVNEHTLWGCLAAMSLYCRELETAEIALAAIDEVDKVQFINYIKGLPSEASKNSALALYCKKINESEQILVQAKLYYRAIKMNIKLFRWERALDLAVKYNTHLDTVVGFRQ